MKTEQSTVTPEQAGLSLVIISGPVAGVNVSKHEGKENLWPHIAYEVALMRDGREVWRGPYKLGVGHVKWPGLRAVEDCIFHPGTQGMTSDEMNVLRIHARRQFVKCTPEGKNTEARAAAKLAKRQKVAPKLDDVAHSLLLDGAAHFDSETFVDWCANYGYDEDSRTAEAAFRTCDETGRTLLRALGRETVDALRNWASNY